MPGRIDDEAGGGAVPTRRIELARRRYDPDEATELTTAVVLAIAEAAGVPPTEVRAPTLYEVVDVDAVERALFDSGATRAHGRSLGSIEFEYASYVVTVESDGWIRVFDPAGGEPEPRT